MSTLLIDWIDGCYFVHMEGNSYSITHGEKGCDNSVKWIVAAQ